MPANGDYVFLKRQDLLTADEIGRVTDVFVSLGVRKVRVTGGEPLLRPDLVDIIGWGHVIDGAPGVDFIFKEL